MIHNLQNTTRKARTPSNDIYLLKEAKAPAVMVEVGFLSHPEESMLLEDMAYQKKLAASIYQGILRFYSGKRMPGRIIPLLLNFLLCYNMQYYIAR